MKSILLFVLLLLPISASAVTIGEVMQNCTDEAFRNKAPEFFECYGYMEGVVHSFAVIANMVEERLYCVPNDVTLGQFVDLMHKEFRFTPEKHQAPAASGVLAVVHQHFPCDSE